MANQVWITSTWCDRFLLMLESFMAVIFSCRVNKYSRIVQDGSNQIKNELNILKYIKQSRFNEFAMLNLMNFNQRRLVNQQAKCALVIWPLAKEVTPLGTTHKNYENSSDYTSDEDFDFLENQLEEGTLDPMTLKMLRGIIQPPKEDRKREGKIGYKSSKKRRYGKGGAEASFSDSVDEYGNEDPWD